MKIQTIHAKNKAILEKEGFKIINYINSPHKLVLYAVHKDGRKIEILV